MIFMKATDFPKNLPTSVGFWLMAIAVGFMALHLGVVWKSRDSNFLALAALNYLAITFLLWKKRARLSLESGIFSSFFGASILALVLVKITALTGGDFILLAPAIAATGIVLLASGIKGCKQYWQELVILFFLGVPEVIIAAFLDLTPFTAKFAAFLLWYSGFDVAREGFDIMLPTGGVEVYEGCSGLEAVTHLLNLAGLAIALFARDWKQMALLPVVAIAIAFVTNGIRVALLTVLAASYNSESFDYWHQGDGSLIFSMISTSLFGFFCLLLLRLDRPKRNSTRL
jgi:cyanoexosortase A